MLVHELADGQIGVEGRSCVLRGTFLAPVGDAVASLDVRTQCCQCVRVRVARILVDETLDVELHSKRDELGARLERLEAALIPPSHQRDDRAPVRTRP
jgi:hypothetical protein